jgi:hypothetical protein
MAVEAGLSFEKRRRFQYNLHFRFRDGGDNPSPRGHSRGGQRAYDHGNFAGKHPRVLPWVDDANSTRSKDKVVAARPAFERIVVGQAKTNSHHHDQDDREHNRDRDPRCDAVQPR